MSRDTGTAPDELRLWLLGGFAAQVGGWRVPETAWRLAKSRSLVKLLALAPGHRLHRDLVLDLLWPDLPPRAAANNLRQTLYWARRALQPPGAEGAGRRYLQLRDEVLQLCPPLWIDVDAFEAAARKARRSREVSDYTAALALYPGDLLPEDRYQEWASARREELRQLAFALLLELAGLYERRGELLAAAEALQRIIAGDALHEAAHAALMRLYALAGQRRRALRQYDQLRELLQRELGTKPDAATQQLYEEIAAGRLPALALAPAPAPAGAPAVGEPVWPPAGDQPSSPPHNLPQPLASFIGREEELTALQRLLRPDRSSAPAGPRLVTLAGAPGCGKTRLALEVARGLLTAYPHGVWFVPLATLADPALVAHEVTAALGLREQPGMAPAEALARALRDKCLLLVLDNCEHVATTCAALAAQLLQTAASLRLLATSREPLHVQGELVWRLPPLALPSLPALSNQPLDLDEVARSEAVRLFVERARLVAPSFRLTEHNASAVVAICQQLDGLPLAIELAAPWMETLGPSELAARLDRRLSLLTHGHRGAAPHHQTLRAALDWSYERLGEVEQVLFSRLSVFAGDFAFAAAEAICGEWPPAAAVPAPAASAGNALLEAGKLLEPLSSLVDKSLVVARPGPEGTVRYRLLETLREYARARLMERGEAELLQRRHATFFLELVEQAEPALAGPEQPAWLARLELEHDNLRGALRWALESRDPEAGELGLRLATALWRFWEIRGHASEGRRWLEQALARAPAARHQEGVRLRAKALTAAGNLARDQDDYERAAALHEASLTLWRELDDQQGIAMSLNNLGVIARDRGDPDELERRCRESLALYHALGDTWGVAISLMNLGFAARYRGELAQAAECFEQSLALFRRLGDQRHTAALLNYLGRVALDRGDTEAAGILFERSLALHQEVGDAWGVAISLSNLAELALQRGGHEPAAGLVEESLVLLRKLGVRRTTAATLEVAAALWLARGQPFRAARLLGAAEALREAIGVKLPPVDRPAHDRLVATVRASLGEAAFRAAWEDGRTMALDDAIACALAAAGPEADPPPEWLFMTPPDHRSATMGGDESSGHADPNS